MLRRSAITQLVITCLLKDGFNILFENRQLPEMCESAFAWKQ